MSNIKVTDLKDSTEVKATETTDVKGGAGYIKFDGIDGEFMKSRPMESLSINFTKIEY